MSAAGVPAFEKEHFWMYLQALGFEPGPATIASGKIVSLTHFGPNMFDKLNRDAFQIVSYFLFQTLDQSLTKELFKFCWPPFDQKRDAEYRKHCCEWLKKISAECGGSFPQVVGSLFMSPGGPKFVHLMYHFAKYVAIKYVKTCSKIADSQVHFTDTFNIKQQDLHRCIARCHIARNRFFQILQRQDCVTRKYQENAQLSVKRLRELRAECVVLQNHLKKMEPYEDQSNLQEKVQKVRSLWALVSEMIVFLEEEREVVGSVLNLVNQYSLDGTDVSVSIPRLLLDNIEKQMCQLHIGNVYEAGKLNLLTIIQLLNEVLKIMKSEQCQADQARLSIDLHYLEKETKFQRKRLSDLKHTRCKIKENLTTIRQSIFEKQGDWHKKWKEFLGLSPFDLITSVSPAVDLLPPMSPLSFDPASEEAYATSILFKYPASLPDTPKQCKQENGSRRESDTWRAANEAAQSPAFLLQSASLSDRSNVNHLEKDTEVRPSLVEEGTTSKKAPESEVEDALADAAKAAWRSAAGGCLPARRSDAFQKEQDHLVEEVAKAVLSDSPKLSEGKEVKLEELIDSLVSNPFLTRKQIPRTPEKLISEIRSSWRKAVEIEDDRRTEPVQMDIEQREILPESFPVLHDQTEFSMASFLSTTAVSDFSPSHLPETRVVTDCFKPVSEKHMAASHAGAAQTPSPSALFNKNVSCVQDLEGTAVQTQLSETCQTEAFSPAPHSRLSVLLRGGQEEHAETPDCLQASYKEPSVPNTALWSSLQLSSGFSCKSFEDTGFGILHETLPEEVGHLSLNSSNNTEFNFEPQPNSPVPSGLCPEDVRDIFTTPRSDFSFQALCSRYEALKKSLSKKKEESDLSIPGTLERHKAELRLAPNNKQTDETFLDTQHSHVDCPKPSVSMALAERKRSLSPLIRFSPEEPRIRTAIPCSLGDLLPNLKEEEIERMSPDAEKASTEMKR
ncbi:HAUS augmin-like complex subunit 6 isoform X1 [Tenrec ecaudatus]|uniref:HAUS augmin-like complex subunit 6 isoform X1 n=1 Tax=Tenrec ecaudatus TaxID=94439 RepID=UPI003F5A4F49